MARPLRRRAAMLAPMHVALFEEAPALVSHPPKAFFRLGGGPENVPDSREQRLLASEGYDAAARFRIAFDAAYVVAPPVAIGGFASVSFRSGSPENGGPGMRETNWTFGAQVPIVLFAVHDQLGVTLSPRLGLVASTLSLYEHGETRWAVAYGGEVGIFYVSRAGAGGGVGIGYLFAPMTAPGALGGRYEAGGLSITFSGALDV